MKPGAAYVDLGHLFPTLHADLQPHQVSKHSFDFFKKDLKLKLNFYIYIFI